MNPNITEYVSTKPFATDLLDSRSSQLYLFECFIKCEVENLLKDFDSSISEGYLNRRVVVHEERSSAKV